MDLKMHEEFSRIAGNRLNIQFESAGMSANGFQLVGAKNFKRHNPKSDKFNVQRFHSVEFW